jgi:hypothetical protein
VWWSFFCVVLFNLNQVGGPQPLLRIEVCRPSFSAQGAAADVSTAFSQFGPGETVSDASQLAVAVEGFGSICTTFLSPGVNVVNSRSFSYADVLPKVDSSEASSKASLSSFGTTSDNFYSSSSPSLVESPPRTVSPRPSSCLPSIQPASHSTGASRPCGGYHTCSHCIRTFKTQHDLE